MLAHVLFSLKFSFRLIQPTEIKNIYCLNESKIKETKKCTKLKISVKWFDCGILFLFFYSPFNRIWRRYERWRKTHNEWMVSGKSEMSPVDSVIRLCLLTYIYLSSALEKLWSFFFSSSLSILFYSILYFSDSRSEFNMLCIERTYEMFRHQTATWTESFSFHFIVFFLFWNALKMHRIVFSMGNRCHIE